MATAKHKSMSSCNSSNITSYFIPLQHYILCFLLVVPFLILLNSAATCLRYSAHHSTLFIHLSSHLDCEFLARKDLVLPITSVFSRPSNIPNHTENTQIFADGIMGNYMVNLKFDIKN